MEIKAHTNSALLVGDAYRPEKNDNIGEQRRLNDQNPDVLRDKATLSDEARRLSEQSVGEESERARAEARESAEKLRIDDRVEGGAERETRTHEARVGFSATA